MVISVQIAVSVGGAVAEEKLAQREEIRKLLHSEELSLYEATSEGDYDTVKAIIDAQPVRLYYRFKYASNRGDIQAELMVIVFVFPSFQDLINIKDTKGLTALAHSSFHGKMEIVKFLVSRGASIYVRDLKQRTPLHWSAQFGHMEILDYLLDDQGGGGGVNTRDVEQCTPLFYAAWQGHIHVVQRLVYRCQSSPCIFLLFLVLVCSTSSSNNSSIKQPTSKGLTGGTFHVFIYNSSSDVTGLS